NAELRHMVLSGQFLQDRQMLPNIALLREVILVEFLQASDLSLLNHQPLARRSADGNGDSRASSCNAVPSRPSSSRIAISSAVSPRPKRSSISCSTFLQNSSSGCAKAARMGP